MNELDINEFYDVYRQFRPDVTRQEFEQEWEQFQQYKARYQQHKALQ